MNLISSALLGLSILFPCISYAAEKGRPEQPNFVMILADDLGWQDVNCYDIDEPSPMETPNIDALAEKGVLFWQGYSPAPTCAPTRCAIMSGNHPARAQKTHVVGGGPPVPYNKEGFRMITPWYSGRMPEGEMTLARVLGENGYATGHCGKWHMAINHNAFPQPEDQGFGWTRRNLGVTKLMKPNRLKEFATDAEGDPFRLDENGFVFDQNTADALEFLGENKAEPFFLYYAAWLVHTPIQTRNKRLLEKYCGKLGVDFPTDPHGWTKEGQNNPYYCAMVEEFDYYVGQVIGYLDETEDPRWPGHKLSENTYVIFTSDNGGMEQHPGEVITDNFPLDRGKISAREGGTRVPLIVTGPGVANGVETDVMANGLDFYPTMLSLAGVAKPEGKNLDGCDLAPLLLKDAKNPTLVKQADGAVRDTMMWHFPHSVAMESTIRVGDWKLIHSYDHQGIGSKGEFALFRLYDSEGETQERVDIEEAKNLAKKMPEKTQELYGKLEAMLSEMKASYPYLNPAFQRELPGKEAVPQVLSRTQEGDEVTFLFKENGAKVIGADLLYTSNGGDKYEEWFKAPAELAGEGKVTARLPEGTTHFVINLIDENNFLVSYPDLPGEKEMAGSQYSDFAIQRNGFE
ncbi:MAG: sulfatase [Akkermansiaceae bacterium]|nr:sulfatase [Akkermansiaceae bacterium]MDP4995244.1 sulfatase [Akkermansiaceae bacterium]